jgi:2-phosphosulfolactate phosphatase
VSGIVRVSRVPDPARVSEGAGLLHTPGLLEPHVCGIAIDVLRATSTLAVAAAAGAARILPFVRTAEAISWRDAHDDALACGERGGAMVPGFDLGNSPAEYSAGRVAGRTLAFSSTNGSRAMLALQGCGTRLAAAFINASTALREAESASEIHIVCAGDMGKPCGEDDALAAWLVLRLLARGFTAADAATEQLAATAPGDPDAIRQRVSQSHHGLRLAGLGPDFERDVEFCASLDRIDVCASW